MKQWQKILGVIAVCVLAYGQVEAKVVLAKNAQQYATGHVSGKVDAIINSMALSAEERTRMLELELRNARQLKANDLVDHIEAHLGFARRRHEQLRSLIVPSEFASDAFVKYCVRVVDAAAPFSDTSDVPGFASVSEERQRSITSRAQRAQKNSEVAEFFGQVKRVHENVSRLVFADKKTSAMTHHFIEAFLTHMKSNYGISAVSMREEIAFRVLDVLVDAQATDSRTIADVVGPFLDTYNTYVTEENKVTADELSVLYFGWPELITTVASSSKHIMLLLSFSMERLKLAVKAQAEMRTHQEELIAKTKEAAAQLKQAGIALDEERVSEPVYVQNQCAVYTNKVITVAGGQDKLSDTDRTVVEQFTNLSSQLNKLSADYEAVVRQQADYEAVRSARSAYDQLPADQQTQLSDLMQGPPTEVSDVYGGGRIKGLPGNVTQQLHRHNKKNSLLSGIVPVVVATGAVIAYDQAVKYARKKEEDGSIEESRFAPLLRFLSSRSTPLEAGKQVLEKVRAKLGLQPKEEPAPVTTEGAGSQVATLPVATASSTVLTVQEEAGGRADLDALLALPPSVPSASQAGGGDTISLAPEEELPAMSGIVSVTGTDDSEPFAGVKASAGRAIADDDDISDDEVAPEFRRLMPPVPTPAGEAPLIAAASATSGSATSAQAQQFTPSSAEEDGDDGASVVAGGRSPGVLPSARPVRVGEVPLSGTPKTIKMVGRLSTPKKETVDAAHVYGHALQLIRRGENLTKKTKAASAIAGNLRSLGVKRADRIETKLLTLLNDLRASESVGDEYVDAVLWHIYGNKWRAKVPPAQAA